MSNKYIRQLTAAGLHLACSTARLPAAPARSSPPSPSFLTNTWLFMYRYIVCAQAGQPANCAVDERGNNGFGNTGSYNIGNFNTVRSCLGLPA